MDDAINTNIAENTVAQQMDWTFDALNLQHDSYIIAMMDIHMWIPVEALLKFPRIKALRINHAITIAEIIQRKCTNAIVDRSLHFVRPSWARPFIFWRALMIPSSVYDRTNEIFLYPYIRYI